MKSGKWSEEEITYLKEHWEDTASSIGKALNRKAFSVRDKKLRLRRRVIRKGNECTYIAVYTPEEMKEAIVRCGITQEYLGMLMGISAGAVNMMVNRTRNTELSTRLLATIILKDLEHEIIDWRKVK